MNIPHLKRDFLPTFRRKKARPSPVGGSATVEARRRRLRRLLTATNSRSRAVALSPARIALFVATTAALGALLCIHLWPNRVSLRLGDISDREIIAQRTVRYEDTEATQQMRADAAQRIEKQYDLVPEATTLAMGNIRTVFDDADRLSRLRLETSKAALTKGHLSLETSKAALTKGHPSAGIVSPIPSPDDDMRSLAADLRRQSSLMIPLSALGELVRADQASREQARKISMALVQKTMGRAITDDSDELVIMKRALRGDPLLTELPAAMRGPVADVADAVVTPTRRYDPKETERRRQSEESSVPPQLIRLTAGTVVIHPGERVTQQHIDEFTALGLQTARPDSVMVAVIVSLVLLLVSIACVYLRLFHADLYEDTPRLLLLATLTVVSVVGLKIGSTLLGIPFRGVQLGYLGMMSVASAGMVIALLLSPRAATLIVALLSVASGLILNNELRFTVITLASSLVGIISVSSLRNRGDILRAIAILCGANALFTVLVGQLEGDLPSELLSGMIWGVVSGGFAVGLFALGVALFEKPFGITTHLRLLELSDPATPILQEFRMRVPGTYAHSLMVGSLAHAAAEAIEADGLLVRVAAYYHDLGKMSRPEFFIENQSNAENIHDRLNPSLSALILSSHVKEGLEMVTAIGIPPRVRELIQQHHGTSLMKYFYHRATGGNLSLKDPSLEAQFRYPGPKPQTKEAAILMLADTVEAASRVLDHPTPSRISDFVAKMIEEKRSDGQLDECDLTQRDLKTILEVFTRTLSGTLHARIEYPSDRRASAAVAAATVPESRQVNSAVPALTLASFPTDDQVSEKDTPAAVDDTLEAPIEHGDISDNPTRTVRSGAESRRRGATRTARDER